MTHKTTIAALLAAAGEKAGEQARHDSRLAARVAWVKERIAALQAAHKRLDAAWDRIFDEHGDDLDDEALEALPDPPEQAEADAIWAEIEAVTEHDRWPRELHWIL